MGADLGGLTAHLVVVELDALEDPAADALLEAALAAGGGPGRGSGGGGGGEAREDGSGAHRSEGGEEIAAGKHGGKDRVHGERREMPARMAADGLSVNRPARTSWA